IDSPGGDPSYTSMVASSPGWLLVCSDGLWNYCSDAPALRDLALEKLAAAGNEPLAAAGALVDWANAQGGHDSVTVALARMIETITDGTYFAVIAGNQLPRLVYPYQSGMVAASAQSRADAKEAVRHLETQGGTAIGTWLRAAVDVFSSVEAAQRHAILLTDGR